MRTGSFDLEQERTTLIIFTRIGDLEIAKTHALSPVSNAQQLSICMKVCVQMEVDFIFQSGLCWTMANDENAWDTLSVDLHLRVFRACRRSTAASCSGIKLREGKSAAVESRPIAGAFT
jgi:hypothetical protein